jgi:hypothetical protein
MTISISQFLQLPTKPEVASCQVLHPKAKHLLISLDGSDKLYLEMFMMEDWAVGTHIIDDTDENEILREFENEYCDDCPYNEEFIELDNNEIEESYVNSSNDSNIFSIVNVTVESPCSICTEGYDAIRSMINNGDVQCPGDHELPSLEAKTKEKEISYDGVSFRCKYYSGMLVGWCEESSPETCYSARFAKLSLNDDGSTDLFSFSSYPVNVYGNGSICWGDNIEPDGIAEAADQYSKTDSNEDLTTYEDHCYWQSEIRSGFDCMQRTLYADKTKVYWDLEDSNPSVFIFSYGNTSMYHLLSLYGDNLGDYSMILASYHKKFKSSDGVIEDVWIARTKSKTCLVFKSMPDSSNQLMYIGPVESSVKS